MFQHIILSPTAFKRIPLRSRSHAFVDALHTESLLSDESRAILQEYHACIAEASGIDGMLMQILWDYIVKKAILVPGTDILARPETEWARLESELHICKKANTRIIVAEDLSAGRRLDLIYKTGIEVADLDAYLNPGPASLIRGEVELEFAPGDEFDVVQWLTNYISDAQFVTLKDGYFVVGRAYEQVRQVLSHVDKNASVILETLSDEARWESRHSGTQGKDRTNAEERIKRLIEDLGLANARYKLHPQKADLRERVLRTNRFSINLGHALGSVKYPECKVISHFSISVRRVGSDGHLPPAGPNQE